jgi:methylmalonyl-CoA mutase C-terminal domain/subunit
MQCDGVEIEMGKIRVLMAKPGYDSHFRGAVVVATTLRNAGMEVIYLGGQQPSEVANTALQEDVDVIGISTLSSTYMEYLTELTSLLKNKGVAEKLLVVGGVVLPDDVPKLKEMGVDGYFPPGSDLVSIVDYIRNGVK